MVAADPRPASPARPHDPLVTRIGSSGVPGATTLRRLGPRLGVETVRDLLFHLPRRYDDLRELRTLADLRTEDNGAVASARVQITGLRVEQTFRRRVQRTTAYLRDDTGEGEATWFGRRFIERRLKEGDWVVVSGRVKQRGFVPTFDNPEFQRDDGSALLHAGRIVPIYPLTEGLSARVLRGAIRGALDRYGAQLSEYLPPDVLARERLIGIGAALEQAHYPESFEARDAALRRLAFDELLALQVGMVSRRRQRTLAQGEPIAVGDDRDTALREGIRAAIAGRAGREIDLTADQVTAMDQLRADVRRHEPMLRLLQGDVGSGKTAVAAYGLGLTAEAGAQAALLAPTDLLARQHYATLVELLGGTEHPVELLTGSLAAASTRSVLEAIANGQASIVVGTHALIQERVQFARLRFVVIDEQHRFGVEQRAQLEAKAGGRSPHVLLMTATPIPRTLGQVVYADLDLSTLHTPPAGRRQVLTAIRHSADLGRLWTFVEQEASRGRATFVVVPAIEDTGDAGVVAAKTEWERLQAVMPRLRIGLVHGQLKAIERDRELGRLRDGELDVLVGTTVLEVGVDVPRATVMVVEAADRFGLAQLHQLRGRVGRGDEQSYAALVSDVAASTAQWNVLVAGDSPPESTEQARLVAVARTNDGFALAEEDFRLRREGNVLGFVQSGLPQLRVASLQREDHVVLASLARAHAEALLDERGDLGPLAEPLQRELRSGWLAPIANGEPGASAA